MTINFGRAVLLVALVTCCSAASAQVQMDEFGDWRRTIGEAREGFQTKIVKSGPAPEAPATPPGRIFDLIKYDAPVGKLAAYVTKPQKPGRYPAMIWITGGDNNSIGDVWSPEPEAFRQSVPAFREAGMVVMFPSQRGGNDNPGQRESFYGEVDDILAAADHLAKLPHVDPNRMYLGGHSTGATLALLVAESTDRFKATFAVGPVAMATHYGGQSLYCASDPQEWQRRAPMNFTSGLTTPVFIIAGQNDSVWQSLQLLDMPVMMTGKSDLVTQISVPGHNHFSVLHPASTVLAREVAATRGDFKLSPAGLQQLTGRR